MADDNTVFIGTKPTMNYVLAVITQFDKGGGEVVLKARGRAISRAVDVAEVVRTKFVPNSKIKNIKIGTEPITVEDGKTINISAIEIYMNK